MIAPSTCGPICQHPGCWKAKCNPKCKSPDIIPTPNLDIPPFKHEFPTLSVSMLEPQEILRHRSLPPIRELVCEQKYGISPKPHSSFHCFRRKAVEVPRVSHIIVQAGFQCHSQKRWIWLPSIQSQQKGPAKPETVVPPPLKDVTDELIQSRPASAKVNHSRGIRSRVMHSRPKGSSYLDLVRKLGYLNLLDLPHYLQVKLLENNHFRKILSSHPIDHLPYNALPETVLLDLIRCQLSPQLPVNPSLEGVGIFFDPPDDLAGKQEPKTVILPKKRDDWPEPNTYVPSTRVIEPSDLPGPQVTPAVVPSFREYVMQKRASTGNSVVEVPQGGANNRLQEEGMTTPGSVTSVTVSPKSSSKSSVRLSEKLSDRDDEDEESRQSLDIILPADDSGEGIRIPSAIEEEELELIGITGSLPPTRDSWRHTSFSTVTPFSDHPGSAAINRDRTQVVTPLTPHTETKTLSADPSLVDVEHIPDKMTFQEFVNPGGVPPPTCTPTEELVQMETEE